MGETSENNEIEISNATVSAFNIIKSKEKEGKSMTLGQDDGPNRTPNKKVFFAVYSPHDQQWHKYFHSFSADQQVTDFMGTAELRCPYDRDLQKYWEIIRNYCIVYGSNEGEQNKKILFIGRVRETAQEGYELRITLQSYGWKFKEIVSQSYANDNVIGKDGYTIMKLIFASLKIDSWVISPTAKYRLKQVGFDSDGNLTLNKKKVEEMPDLLKRLQYTDPKYAINQYTVYNKIKESLEGNVKNINYTLRYEKPTAQMKKISSEGSGSYSAGQNVYSTDYGTSSGVSDGVSAATGSSSSSKSSGKQAPKNLCSNIVSTSIRKHMKTIWLYNGGYTNDYTKAKNDVIAYSKKYPEAYKSQVSPCLNTMSKRLLRKDKINAAKILKQQCDANANYAILRKNAKNTVAWGVSQVAKTVNNVASGKWITDTGKALQNTGKSIWNYITGK